jgi:hypothetical protein
MIKNLCLTEHPHAYAVIHPRILLDQQTQYIKAHNASVKAALQQFESDSAKVVSGTDDTKQYKTEFEERVASTFEDIRRVRYCIACILMHVRTTHHD